MELFTVESDDCDSVRKRLKDLKADYVETDVSEKIIREFKKQGNVITPVLLDNGQHYRGIEDIISYLDNDYVSS